MIHHDIPPVVQPIPRGSAPGEICPVVSAEVSYSPQLAAGLTDLIERHAVSHAFAMLAQSELAAAQERYQVVRPLHPEAIYYRFDDPVPPPLARVLCPDGRRRMIYESEDIRELESADPCCFSSGDADSPQGPGMAWRPDPRGMARKTEILTAYSDWQSECAYWADQVGWTRADAEARRAWDEAQRIEIEILDFQPSTFAEIATKSRWLVAQGKLGDWAAVIVYEIIDFAASAAPRATHDLMPTAQGEAA